MRDRADSPSDSQVVSIIVPVFNAERTLAQCLDSIRAQTHAQLDILCIDDGSTDGSVQMLDAYALNDDRIRVLRKPNGGYGSACNSGLAEVRGAWISIVEPDDWIEPRMYERMLAFAASFTAPIDIIKTPYWRIVNPDTPEQCKLPCRYAGQVKPPQQPFTIGEAADIMRYHPSIWSALYRTDFLRARDIRFPEIPGAGWADNPFLVETLCQAKGIAYLDEPFYCYREDTEEKNDAFARKNPLMVFERWNDISDLMERLNVTSTEVWSIQYKRAFRYLSIVEKAVGPDAPGVPEATLAMFKRMNPDGVFAEPDITPAQKRRFAQALGLPEPRINHARRGAWLAKQALKELRQTGLKQTLQTINAKIRH